MNSPTKSKIKKPTKPLTPAQKRVAIAKDVLKQIASHKLNMQRGAFIKVPVGIERINKKELSKLKKPCTVCAIGAAICSGIRLFNKIDLEIDPSSHQIDTHDSADDFQLIRRWFGTTNAILIETAFEVGDGYCSYFIDLPKQTSEAKEFGLQFDSEEDRAKAIFQNIIKNKGIFKP